MYKLKTNENRITSQVSYLHHIVHGCGHTSNHVLHDCDDILTEGKAGALLSHAVEGHSKVRIARTEVG